LEKRHFGFAPVLMIRLEEDFRVLTERRKEARKEGAKGCRMRGLATKGGCTLPALRKKGGIFLTACGPGCGRRGASALRRELRGKEVGEKNWGREESPDLRAGRYFLKRAGDANELGVHYGFREKGGDTKARKKALQYLGRT